MAKTREQLEVLIESVGMGQVQSELRNLGDQAKKTGTDTAAMGDKLKSSGSKVTEFGSALKLAFGAAIGAGAVQALRGAIGAASDLNETVSKTQVIFGDSGAAILDWSQKSATALGQSRQQALDAASTFATFGKAAGLAGNDLVGFSTSLTQMSADFASFYNSSPEEAITAIGAALRGENEPIRRFGVLLNDATLKQEALKMGLVKTTTEALTPQQKTLAAYNVILAQSKDAQGDFARTSDGVANRSRIVAAQFENVKVSLGQALLPAVQLTLTFMQKLMEAFAAIPAPVKVFVGVFVSLIAAAYGAVKAFEAVKQGLAVLKLAIMANPVGLLIGALISLAAALVYAYKHSETFRTAVNNAFRFIAPVVGAVVGYVIGALSSLVKGFSGAISGILEVASHLPLVGDKAKAAQAAMNGAAAGITQSLDGMAARSQDMVVKFGANLSDKLPKVAKEGSKASADALAATTGLFDTAGANLGNAVATGVKKKTGAVKKAVKDVVEEAKKQLTQFTNDVQDILASTSAKRALAKAEKELNALYAEQAGLGDAIAQAQLRINRARQDGAAITAEERVAIEDAQSALDDANKAMAEYASLPAQIAEAQARLAAVQGDSEASASDLKDAEKSLADLRKQYAEGAPYSPAKLQVLEQKLAQAKADAIAPTDDLKDAEAELAELRKREVEIQNDIADANQAVTDKTFALIEAQQKAQAAQDDLAKNGKNLIDYFTQLGMAAGLSADQINRVVDGIKAQAGLSVVTGAAAASVDSMFPALTQKDYAAAKILTTQYPLLDRGAERVQVTNNITVEGSVISEQQLVNTMRSGLLYGQYYGQQLVL